MYICFKHKYSVGVSFDIDMDQWEQEQLGQVEWVEDQPDPEPAIMLNPIMNDPDEMNPIYNPEPLQVHEPFENDAGYEADDEEEDEEEEDPEEDPEGEDLMGWQEIVPPVYSPAISICLDPEEDWYSSFVPEDDDKPVVYQLYHNPTNPLQKIELALAQITEERDVLLQQQATNWGRIKELEGNIVKLQQQLKETQRVYVDSVDESHTFLEQKNEQISINERVQHELNQTRRLLEEERVRSDYAQRQATTSHRTVERLCARLDLEMSLANREEYLDDKEFVAHVDIIDRRRAARRHMEEQRRRYRLEANEGSSRHRS